MADTELPERHLRSTTCKSCGARIVWVRTAEGRNMPIDTQPSPAGNVRIIGLKGNHPVVAVYRDADTAAGLADPDEQRWLSHFATCPQAAEHRRKP